MNIFALLNMHLGKLRHTYEKIHKTVCLKNFKKKQNKTEKMQSNKKKYNFFVKAKKRYK